MKVFRPILYLIIFFVGYAIILELPVGGILVAVPVVLETTEIVWFNLSLSTLLDIIITSPFAVLVFYLMQKSLKSLPETMDSKPSESQKKFIDGLLVGAVICFIIGVIMHAVANGLNGIAGNPVPPGSDLLIAIYYFDEVLGHKLIHVGIICFLIGCMTIQFWRRAPFQLSKLDKFGVYFWPYAIGTGYMLTLVEGQAAFEIAVISLVLISLILFFILVKHLKLGENPYTQFVLFFLIAIVISVIIFGVITGFKPGYPFFYQLNEL